MSKVIVDYEHRTAAEKKDFLNKNSSHQVVMDFSTIDPLPFYQQFPQLIGSFPGLFIIDGRCELHLRQNCPEAEKSFLDNGITPIRTSIAGLGFTVPRTLAMIINEAYFALEEKVASASDIDRAMRYGVNYPKGPFEWGKGRERVIIELLNELKKTTNDSRYEVSPQLEKSIS